MSSDNEHRENPHDLKPVEQTLAAFAPRAPQLDRDRLMFLAGAESVQGSGFGVQGSGVTVPVITKSRGSWVWPAATAAMAATSLALAVALFLRPEPRVQI